ncbi:hypothetical protein C8D88_11832 [Lentzea atacamensis]|uniref:Uncharacterized protein n=1 Tax=Lentzea atacamensis TaxID=531938 RepID=A0A316HSG5_9PSEU|nr:hypothetical protein [Lentzea atacamensis]PWK81264.1 hypothetical protein C8D88_11832 [Lentzea atacamensis]
MAEDGGSAEEKSEEPPKEADPGQDAQEKAGDPENAHRWRKRSSEVDIALQALVGGTANLFFGPTSVGQLGDRGQKANHHLGVVVRSGPVPRQVLDRIRESFVEPPHYAMVKQKLMSTQVVLFQMRSGTGRTATALRLLDQLCAAGVRKLDPDATLKTLQEKDLEENHGYLLESLEADQARELQAFQIERLGRLMDEKGSRLIVIVDESTPLRFHDIGDLVIGDLGHVAPERLLQQHLSDAAVLEKPEVKEIVAELTDDIPRRELAQLADLLREVAEGRAELTAVKERFSRAGEANFVEWFDRQTDIEQRAFVIALAVFNDEPVQIVSQAATLLAEHIKAVEIPRRTDRARQLFTVPLQRRISDANAELVEDTAETAFGAVPVRKARFRDDRYPYRVLQLICAQYDQAHEVVRGWLFGLGVIPGDQVRIRAGMAAGLLSLQDFPSIYQTLIEPWAAIGDENARWAAVAALTIPGQHPALSRVVCEVLKKWSRSSDMELRTTAAQALGSTSAMSTRACLRLLRQLARYADWGIAYAVGESVTDLLARVDDRGAVLGALVRWSRDDEHPKRRETALLAVLIASSYLVVTVDGGSEKWPALVWEAENDEERRAQIVRLYARMLLAAEFNRRGYLALRDWTKVAQKDQSMREPLARLLFDVGTESGELDSIRYYVEYWRDEHDGPADAARAILRHFKQREA